MTTKNRGCFPFSIGTNIFEGPVPRLERSHLAALRAAGVEYYELHVGYRFALGPAGQPWHITASFVNLEDEAFLDDVAHWQSELGLRAVQMHAPCSDTALDFAALDESGRQAASNLLATAIRAAARLDIPAVVVHPHLTDTAEFGGKERILTQLRRTLVERLAEAVKARTCLALENLPHWPNGLNLEDLRVLCEELDSPAVGLCLDTGHARLAGGQPAAGVRACGPWLRALHLHDNFGQGDEHLLPFDGDSDWSGFVAALGEVGYPGTLNLELTYGPYQDKYASPRALIEEAMRRVEELYGR